MKIIHISDHKLHSNKQECIIITLNLSWQLLNMLLQQIQNLMLHYTPRAWITLSSNQSLSPVRLFTTPSTAAHQASLSFTISWSFLNSCPSMPSNRLILCHPLLFMSSVFQGLFQWVDSSHQVAKILELQLQYQSFQCIFRVDFL